MITKAAHVVLVAGVLGLSVVVPHPSDASSDHGMIAGVKGVLSADIVDPRLANQRQGPWVSTKLPHPPDEAIVERVERSREGPWVSSEPSQHPGTLQEQ